MKGKPGRVVVRAPNWLGDVVFSLAAIRDLRRNLPAARIEVLVRPALAEIYAAVREVDGVRRSSGLREEVRTLRGAFDAAVLLPNSFGTALAPYLARVPARWGYATDGRGALLTRRARVPAGLRGRSKVYYYRAMLAGIGLEVSASPDASLRCPEEWAARGAALLGEDGDWLGINPGAPSRGTALPRSLRGGRRRIARETGARVAVVGGASERPWANVAGSCAR